MLTIHVVPNAHLDPAWLWDWREGMNEGIATCQAMVELMEENQDVTFVRNEAFIYEHVEQYAPAVFARIGDLVRQGRWEIAGGTLLQPDTNLGSGESYVRQYLYGQQYFKERFGIVPEVAYQVDSFGHAWGLASIYRQAGCRFAVQCRPSQQERPTPSRIFRWRGPDGSEVLTANLESYGLELVENDPNYTLTARIHRALEQAPTEVADWVLLVGFGDHGGGLNRQLVAEIRELIANPPHGCRVRFSTLGAFFQTIADQWTAFPVVDGELQFSFRGCYSSVLPVKQSYREAENLTQAAERWSTVADLLGCREYPRQDVERLWRDVLFNQFHDILPGTSIERVCREALDHLGRARHEAKTVANRAALSVFLGIDTRRFTGVPVLLFNPHGRPYHGQVELEWLLDYRPLGPGGEERKVKHLCATDPDGTVWPVQMLDPDTLSSSEWRVRGCFEAQIPACGYRVYWLGPAGRPAEVEKPVIVDESLAEVSIGNGHVRLSYRQGENGVRIVDARGNAWGVDGPAGRAVVLEDKGNAWGTGIDAWTKQIGSFTVHTARISSRGPIKASLLLVCRHEGSELIQEFSVYVGSPSVFVKVRLLWNEPGRILKLEFPVEGNPSMVRCSGPYGVVERDCAIGEFPIQDWVSVCESNRRGLGIGTSGGYGFDFHEGKLRMTVVKSTLYGSPLAPVGRLFERPVMDTGHHAFDYVLASPETVSWAAQELNMPIQATLGFSHAGTLPAERSILAVRAEAVRLVAVKKAQDGKGWILRLWENSGQIQTAAVDVLGETVGIFSLQPWQLLTLRLIRTDQGWRVSPVTLTEK